jgi:hypothetical protein
MIKAIVAIIGMLATGFIVWKLLQWQGNATDAKGNIIAGKPRDSRAEAGNDSTDQ